MTAIEIQTEALQRATTSPSIANYPAIFEGFAEKGISEDDIRPRENVFTYDAWRALGRQVRRGEHGVKVTTWVPIRKRNDDGDQEIVGKRPKTTTVFHVSQTDPIAR